MIGSNHSLSRLKLPDCRADDSVERMSERQYLENGDTAVLC